MRSMNWMLRTLRRDFPEFTFESSSKFLWSATKKTICVDMEAPYGQVFALHELSHALLGHIGYEKDIELLKLERDAWEYAKSMLAPRYKMDIDDNLIQDNLDTYRTWLHARSSCPACEAIGLQTKDRQYRCLACGHRWRVNDARLCALRRYAIQQK